MGKIKKRVIAPDPQYNNVEVSKLINRLMRHGKKNTARRVVYDSFNIIEKKTKKDPVETFKKALENVSPQVEVRSKRVGGATYQVPFQVQPDRALTLAIRWIVTSCRNKKGKTMAEILANELVDASQQTGEAFKKKNDIYKMAQANKAFSHLAR